jgi:hypothetical protein
MPSLQFLHSKGSLCLRCTSTVPLVRRYGKSKPKPQPPFGHQLKAMSLLLRSSDKGTLHAGRRLDHSDSDGDRLRRRRRQRDKATAPSAAESMSSTGTELLQHLLQNAASSLCNLLKEDSFLSVFCLLRSVGHFHREFFVCKQKAPKHFAQTFVCVYLLSCACSLFKTICAEIAWAKALSA